MCLYIFLFLFFFNFSLDIVKNIDWNYIICSIEIHTLRVFVFVCVCWLFVCMCCCVLLLLLLLLLLLVLLLFVLLFVLLLEREGERERGGEGEGLKKGCLRASVAVNLFFGFGFSKPNNKSYSTWKLINSDYKNVFFFMLHFPNKNEALWKWQPFLPILFIYLFL